MRRPVLYLAGLMLATGASLVLAGPASAAPSHDSVKSHGNHWYHDYDECDDDYDWHYRHHRYYGGGNGNVYSTQTNGISLLSGNIGGLL